jgi:arylsulfatase
MKPKKHGHAQLSRRSSLARMPAAVAGAALLGSAVAKPARAARDAYNILFIFTDQERHARPMPPGLSLPGHERLQRTGITFDNHYIGAVMCSSSRAVLLTGLQTPDNGIFENLNVPWVPNLSTAIPTIGHMLRKAGYYTAYKGKWHLTREFDQHEPDHLFTKEMEQYGFADYASPGDVVGHTLGGYQFDDLIADSAVAWLRRKGRPLNDDGKPWCLTLSLVNPHDIVYFSTDLPGQPVQESGRLISRRPRRLVTSSTRRHGRCPSRRASPSPSTSTAARRLTANIRRGGMPCWDISRRRKRAGAGSTTSTSTAFAPWTSS